VRPSFIFVILASGSNGFCQSVFDPLLPSPIEPRQCRSRWRLDAGLYGEPCQEFLVRLAGVAADDAAHGGVGFQRRRVDRHRPAFQQLSGR
jgi:hypothetical protein